MPSTPEQLKPLKTASERVNVFAELWVMLTTPKVFMSRTPPSVGYEPLLIDRGFKPEVARGVAALLVRVGKRRARESQWRRGVITAFRFLAGPQRSKRAILRKATYLLEAWEETSIIETIFNEAGFSEQAFINLLKMVVEGHEIDYRRIAEIAVALGPALKISRGPKISAASAAHEFFLEEVGQVVNSHGYTWSGIEENFTDAATNATRLEFADPDFDPRPAHRRVKAQRSGRRATIG